jgi:hypothetical protein
VEDLAHAGLEQQLLLVVGTMPPTTTRTLPRPASRSAVISLGTIRWSVASDEMPTTSTSSSVASFTTAAMLCHGGV